VRELPPNWTLARVGDLVELGPKNDCPDNTEVGFVPLQRLGVDYRSRHTFEPKPWSAVKKGYTHFADGDVLLARITPSFENGKAGIVRGLPNGIGAGSTEYFVCRPIEGAVLPEYLLTHFKTPEFLRDGEQVMSGAVGQQRVPKQYVLDSELRLPPFNEQKRIVDKLDAVLARVDACRERFDRVPAILKRFRQAVIASATCGKLMEVRGAAGDLAEWQQVRLDEICHSITDGDHQAPPQVDHGIPFITISAINDGRLRIENATRYVSASYFEQRKPERRPHLGDVLFSVTGSIGIPAIVDTERPFTFQRHIAILKPNLSRISSSYLWLGLGTENIRKQALAVATGTAQLTIPLSGLRSFVIDLPTIAQQYEIIRRVEVLFTYADRLEARYTAARTQVERLTPALLAKAFRGELVPQDPSDEPASVLLERIRAARAEQPTAKRRRNPPATRVPRAPKEKAAMTKSRQDDDVHHKPYLAGLLREAGGITSVEDLFRRAELPVTDFYKQLAWEVENGHIRDDDTRLEAA
jgi:type I restriction enzyme, S subunit